MKNKIESRYKSVRLLLGPFIHKIKVKHSNHYAAKTCIIVSKKRTLYRLYAYIHYYFGQLNTFEFLCVIFLENVSHTIK